MNERPLLCICVALLLSISVFGASTAPVNPFSFNVMALAADSTESENDAAAEMARKLQDPLANMSAVMTDNDILFNAGTKKRSYGFQIQPVKSFDFPDQDFSFVARGVIPILGLAPESQRPIIGPPLPEGSSYTWGLGDIISQFFVAPKTDGDWKWGAGPQVSWRTRTDSDLAGPGWGAGPVGILVGSLSDDISAACIFGHLWGADNGFSTTMIQPTVYYNSPYLPGVAIGYNAPITYDWSASSGNQWTVPLGGMIGRTFDLGRGYGLDMNVGAYWNATKPEGAPDWQIKWGLSLLFP